LEFAYKIKFWRPPGCSDSDDSDGALKLKRNKSNLGSEAGSSVVKSQGKGNDKKNEKENKQPVINDGLGNSNMTQLLSQTNLAR
jgi:hypothetical protein